MKKKLLATMAAALVLGYAGTSFAANPFVDVPANHWSYKAVMDLSKAGLVDGMGDGTFKGDKVMTRYEMAQIIAKAMTKVDKADAAQKAQLQKLQNEYASELQNLGVKVDGLKAQVDNMPKFSGEVRVRYNDEQGASSSTVKDELRTRIYMTGKINDTWTYNTRFQNTQNLRANGSSVTVDENLAYVQGNVLAGTVKAGRTTYMPVYGLVADSTINGISYKAGKDVTYGVYYGKPDAGTGLSDTTLTAGEIGGNIGSVTAKAGYFHFKPSAAEARNIWEVGANTKFNDFGLKANYAKADVDNDVNDKAYVVGLTYKGWDKSKPGSFGAAVSYQRIGNKAVQDTTYDFTAGRKGYEVNVGTALDKNMVLVGTYMDQKDIADSSIKTKVYRADMFFYF